MHNRAKPKVVIISPALRLANNGNWRTAYRWARFLEAHYKVNIAGDWETEARAPDCLVALHARRSALPIARFAERYPQRPIVLVLTGTDLYRDIRSDRAAQESLRLSHKLVVLQDVAPAELDAAAQAKCVVIYQSARTLKPGTPARRHFDVALVAHMRAEKDPLTPMRALQLLNAESSLRLLQIGDALDAGFSEAAAALARRDQRYLWLGALPHAATRQRIKGARLLVNSSVMEGGANVLIEAITCGVPVLASAIPGNIGMLGAGYAGYFPPGDAPALAALLVRAMHDPRFMRELRRQCAARAPLFRPQRERREVITLLHSLLRLTPS